MCLKKVLETILECNVLWNGYKFMIKNIKHKLYKLHLNFTNPHFTYKEWYCKSIKKTHHSFKQFTATSVDVVP